MVVPLRVGIRRTPDVELRIQHATGAALKAIQVVEPCCNERRRKIMADDKKFVGFICIGCGSTASA